MPELSGAVLRRTETSRQKQGNPEGVQVHDHYGVRYEILRFWGPDTMMVVQMDPLGKLQKVGHIHQNRRSDIQATQ